MALSWHAFAVPKRGNSTEEYEDAFAANPNAGRFAIADGASESSFASLWAKLLVESFAHPPPKGNLGTDWLEPLRQEWSSEVGKLQMPWYAEAKGALGASAAFLGLILKRSRKTAGGIWLASAIGDCCLFQIHEEELVKAFPVTRSGDFGNQPKLLNSRSGARGNSQDQGIEQARGRWCPGDRFLLMTDALAQWFLHRHEAGPSPWKSLEIILHDQAPDKALRIWIDELREQRGLRNDDATLVIIDTITEANWSDEPAATAEPAWAGTPPPLRALMPEVEHHDLEDEALKPARGYRIGVAAPMVAAGILVSGLCLWLVFEGSTHKSEMASVQKAPAPPTPTPPLGACPDIPSLGMGANDQSIQIRLNG